MKMKNIIKLFVVLFVVLLFSFVSAETCEELDVCDQTCEDLDGEVCDEGDGCEGQGIIMEDGSLCCTLIGCYTQEQLDDYLYLQDQEPEPYEYLGVDEETGEEEFEQGFPIWIYLVIGVGILVFIFILILIFVKPKQPGQVTQVPNAPQRSIQQ